MAAYQSDSSDMKPLESPTDRTRRVNVDGERFALQAEDYELIASGLVRPSELTAMTDEERESLILVYHTSLMVRERRPPESF